MGLSIRQITASEVEVLLPLLDQVQALHVAAHPDEFRDDQDAGEIADWLAGWLAQDGVTALVAVSDAGEAVGYAIFEIVERAESILKKDARVGVLHHISVDRAWRGQGIGSRLVGKVKSRLRAAGAVRIEGTYFVFNTASEALMRKAGMVPKFVTAEGAV